MSSVRVIVRSGAVIVCDIVALLHGRKRRAKRKPGQAGGPRLAAHDGHEELYRRADLDARRAVPAGPIDGWTRPSSRNDRLNLWKRRHPHADGARRSAVRDASHV